MNTTVRKRINGRDYWIRTMRFIPGVVEEVQVFIRVTDENQPWLSYMRKVRSFKYINGALV